MEDAIVTAKNRKSQARAVLQRATALAAMPSTLSSTLPILYAEAAAAWEIIVEDQDGKAAFADFEEWVGVLRSTPSEIERLERMLNLFPHQAGAFLMPAHEEAGADPDPDVLAALIADLEELVALDDPQVVVARAERAAAIAALTDEERAWYDARQRGDVDCKSCPSDALRCSHVDADQ